MHRKGLLFVFFTALISGFSIFVNKFGVAMGNPFVYTFGKNVVVALFLFSVIIALKEFQHLKALRKEEWGKLVLIGLCGGSIPFLLFFKGLQLTSAAQGAFIHKTMFLYVAILAMFFLKERLNKKIIFAAVLLLAGNILLLKLTAFSLGIGDLLILLATLFWAVETTISKHTLRNMSSNIVAFGRMAFGSLFIFAFLLASGNMMAIATLSLSQIGWILLTSVFLFFYVFTWYTGLKYVKATVATSVLLLGSVVTTLLNYAYAGSAFTMMQGVGMLLLVAGIIVVVYLFGLLEKKEIVLVKS